MAGPSAVRFAAFVLILLCSAPSWGERAVGRSHALDGLAQMAGAGRVAASRTPESAQEQSPPARWTKAEIAEMVRQTLKTRAPDLETRALDSAHWSDYINHHHYVSSVYDDIAEDVVLDYGAQASRMQSLPVADVTEDGLFLYWWEVCNFYRLGEAPCRDIIDRVASHESRHFAQWRALASQAGTRDAFMEKWADGRHYQCREVEVYVSQALSGEIWRLETSRYYRLVKFYASGCAKSRWSRDFEPYLRQVERLFAPPVRPGR